MKKYCVARFNVFQAIFSYSASLTKRILFFFATVLFGSILLASFSLPAFADTLDFGWGSPFVLHQKGNQHFLAWPIQVSNSTKKRIFAQIDVVVVTDTGIQYTALAKLPEDNLVNVRNVSVLNNNIFPSVTQRTVVVFESVDPRATLLHFYVGGVMNSSLSVQEKDRYFRVTYRRTKTGWEWNGSNALE